MSANLLTNIYTRTHIQYNPFKRCDKSAITPWLVAKLLVCSFIHSQLYLIESNLGVVSLRITHTNFYRELLICIYICIYKYVLMHENLIIRKTGIKCHKLILIYWSCLITINTKLIWLIEPTRTKIIITFTYIRLLV